MRPSKIEPLPLGLFPSPSRRVNELPDLSATKCTLLSLVTLPGRWFWPFPSRERKIGERMGAADAKLRAGANPDC